MLIAIAENPVVTRTERGLSIVGTRITVYDVMDYLHADWPPKLIQDWLNLTPEQMAGVMDYINQHREEVEAEYQRVLERAEEIRQYWEERNRERGPQLDPDQLSPERRALWDKLQVWKERIGNGDYGTRGSQH
jgi:uncharacterized protein (DUF433 family)